MFLIRAILKNRVYTECVTLNKDIELLLLLLLLLSTILERSISIYHPWIFVQNSRD